MLEPDANRRVYLVTYTDHYDSACHFWDDLMGAQIELRWDEMGRGTIWRVSGNAYVEIKEASDAWTPGMQVGIEVASPAVVDEWFTRMKTAGVVSTQEPTDRPWGHRNATVVDPCGIRVTCFASL